MKIAYSLVWALLVLPPISKRVYESVSDLPPYRAHSVDTTSCRFPRSLPFVIIDTVERFYIAGFALLQLFVLAFPLLARTRSQSEGEESTMEFLPLMMTSVYCAVGLVWAFLRLSVIYLKDA